MNTLLEEMQQCQSIDECIGCALVDAYGDAEQALAWLTCIDEMFGRFRQVKVIGHEVELAGFDVSNDTVIAICRQGKKKARVALESIEFPELTPIETRWLKAWKRFARRIG